MGGNNEKAWETRRALYGQAGSPPESLERMHQGAVAGGLASSKHNFKGNRELARQAGAKGGRKSRRGKPVDKSIDKDPLL